MRNRIQNELLEHDDGGGNKPRQQQSPPQILTNAKQQQQQQRRRGSLDRNVVGIFLGIAGLLYLLVVNLPSTSTSTPPTITTRRAAEKRHPREGRQKATGLDPAKWETFKFNDLRQYFGCTQLFEKPRPVISQGNWRYFRDLYNQHIESYVPNADGGDTSYKLGKVPFEMKVEGALTEDKGRGIIASRDIAKDEMIFTGTNNTIVFRTGHSWRKLLWHLYHAPSSDGYEEGFACDVLAWSWNQRVPGNDKGPVRILVDIDESSLLNQPSVGEEANIQCGKGENPKCGVDYYALEDIKKGDEILCEYSDFSSPSWHKMGL